MKLATWHVNALMARMPGVLEFLGLHRQDILFIQETKTEPNAFPPPELEAAGYRAVHHGPGRWAGVALLARGEVDGGIDRSFSHRPRPSDHAPLVCMEWGSQAVATGLPRC